MFQRNFNYWFIYTAEKNAFSKWAGDLPFVADSLEQEIAN
jgi:hypothetical protein